MKKLISMLLVAVSLVMFTGCAGTQVGDWWSGRKSVCDDVTTKSYLCETAAKLNIKVEDAGRLFLIANDVAIAEGLYTKEQFNEVVNTVLDYLEYEGERGMLTFDGLKEKLYDALDKYPGLVIAVESYLDMFLNESGLIPDADREIITNWLVSLLKK